MVFLFVLPPLLYPAALFTSWRDFRANLRPIALLAIGLVLFNVEVVGRLKPEISLNQAKAELETVARRLDLRLGDYRKKWGITITPIIEPVGGTVRPTLLVLLGAVGFSSAQASIPIPRCCPRGGCGLEHLKIAYCLRKNSSIVCG
jgi:hypothetical protein